MLKNDKICKKLRKIRQIVNFVQIDFSFLLLLIIMFFLGEIKLFFCYILFLFFHELAHFFLAKKLGYLSSKIRLSIMGASLEGDDDFLFSDEIKIVLVGPLLNLFFVTFCLILFWCFPETYEIFYDVMLVNLAIFSFNILPIFPLDCGRLILAFLSCKKIRSDAVKTSQQISLCFVIFLFVIYLVSVFVNFNFRFGFVCLNLAILVFSSSRDTSYKRSFFAKNKYKKLCLGLIERTIVLSDISSDKFLFKFIDDSHFTRFVILDKALNKMSEITELELFRKYDLL